MLHDISPGGGADALLYDFVVAGADQASIDTNVDGPFAGLLNTSFALLEVFATLRTDNAASVSQVNFTLNNDGSGNYDFQDGGAANTSALAATAAAASNVPIFFHGSGGGASYTTTMRMTIHNYGGTTFFKTGELTCGRPDSTAANNAWVGYGFTWRSTSAVTRLKFAGNSTDKLKVGSRVTVYGR